MKLAAIINPMSRTVPADAAEALETAVRDAGHDLVLMRCSADDLSTNVNEAAGSDADAVIAWGGDGTLACALTACGAADIPVLVLPGGTMNMLPHRLHGKTDDWQDILNRTLADPVADTIGAGMIGEQRFYVAALFGRLTAFAESREAMRQGALLEAAQAVIGNQVLDVKTRLRITSRHKSGEKLTSAVAAAIVVSDEEVPALEVAAVDPESTFELLATAVDAMMHGWRDAEPVERDISRSITIHDLGDGKIPATLDGERVMFDTPVEVKMLDNAARILRAGAGG